jgi:hypothetical protein
MTFICTFRGVDSVTFGADTQETVDSNKVYAEKILTVEHPWGAVVIGGAGNGELCDGFVQAVRDDFGGIKPSSLLDVETGLKETLRTFYREDVAYASPKHRRVKLLIGASLGKDVALWQTTGQRLVSVPDLAIVGYEAPIYQYFAKRLHRLCEYPSQSVLAMAYLIGIAKDTGEGVGGNSHITVLRNGRAFPETKEYVDSIVGRIAEFANLIDRFFLVSMDLCFPEDKFRGCVRQFENLLVMLRTKHAFEAAQISVRNANDPSWKGDAYPKLIPGTLQILHRKVFFISDKAFVTPACSNPAESASIPSAIAFVGDTLHSPETQRRIRRKRNKSRGG